MRNTDFRKDTYYEFIPPPHVTTAWDVDFHIWGWGRTVTIFQKNSSPENKTQHLLTNPNLSFGLSLHCFVVLGMERIEE